MFPKRLDFDLAFESFSVSGSVPLLPVEVAFNRLMQRNAASRSLDEEGICPVLSVRIVCPRCSAPIFLLTSVVREGELLRACRYCRSEFPVEI